MKVSESYSIHHSHTLKVGVTELPYNRFLGWSHLPSH